MKQQEIKRMFNIQDLTPGHLLRGGCWMGGRTFGPWELSFIFPAPAASHFPHHGHSFVVDHFDEINS